MLQNDVRIDAGETDAIGPSSPSMSIIVRVLYVHCTCIVRLSYVYGMIIVQFSYDYRMNFATMSYTHPAHFSVFYQHFRAEAPLARTRQYRWCIHFPKHYSHAPTCTRKLAFLFLCVVQGIIPQAATAVDWTWKASSRDLLDSV